VTFDSKGKPVKYDLVCSGKCKDDSDCVKRSAPNLHGGVREWCGCRGSDEPTACHTVIYRRGNGESHPGQHVILCAGGCNEPEHCVLLEGDDSKPLPEDPEEGWLPEWKTYPKYADKKIFVRCKCRKSS
jgi:hypothetical protein